MAASEWLRARCGVFLPQLVTHLHQPEHPHMTKNTQGPKQDLVSFAVHKTVIDTIERLAADAMITRAQMVRQLIAAQLRANGELPDNALLMPKSGAGGR